MKVVLDFWLGMGVAAEGKEHKKYPSNNWLTRFDVIPIQEIKQGCASELALH